ncbi:MAG: hypothetical protein ABI821_15895 [Pseudomonadota bacterium]
MTHRKTVNLFGTAALAMLLVGGAAIARDGQRPRASQVQRVSQPHNRTTERQRTENGHTRNDTVTRVDGATATREAVVTHDQGAGTRTRNVDYKGFDGKTRSVDSVATRTGDGHTRSTTVTNPKGETATRDMTVSRDKERGTVSRTASSTTFNGREGSMTGVIQRTDDGFSRDTTRGLPNGETHTRAVDVSCDGEGKCVRQVEVDQKP